jgi:hypothetical protein
MPKVSNRRHDRKTFFKYMPSSTAKIVLAHSTLRWSSPLQFNDPFDVPRELAFGISSKDVSEALAARLAELLSNPPDDTSHFKPKLQIILEAARTSSPLARSELVAEFKKEAQSLLPADTGMNELRALWRSWIPEFRILCLTEGPEHAAMWYHYADKYQGAVLEFRCIDELDSPLLLAERVTYPTVKPEVFTAAGWAKLLMTPQEQAKAELFHVATYTKSPDWSYENEWRITAFRDDKDTGFFTDTKFHPIELAGIYLGPRISAEDRSALIQAAAKYPNARIDEVSIGMSREFIVHALEISAPTVTFIVGLCGSGKSMLANELKKTSDSELFDDSFAFDSAKHVSLVDLLNRGKSCIVVDVPYCIEANRQAIEAFIKAEVKSVKIRWIYFENTPTKANLNLLKRPDRNPEAHIQINSHASAAYFIPEGAEVRQIVT